MIRLERTGASKIARWNELMQLGLSLCPIVQVVFFSLYVFELLLQPEVPLLMF